MVKKYSLVLLLLLAVFLNGCNTVQKKEESFWLVPGVSANLPSSSCTKDTESMELLTVEYQASNKQLIAVQGCKAGKLDLAILLPNWVRLFSMTRYEGIINVKKYMDIPLPFEPEQVLWDILLTQLNVNQLQSTVPEGYEIRDKGSQRLIINPDGGLVARVTYESSQPVLLENFAFGYKIKIKKLQ